MFRCFDSRLAWQEEEEVLRHDSWSHFNSKPGKLCIFHGLREYCFGLKEYLTCLCRRNTRSSKTDGMPFFTSKRSLLFSNIFWLSKVIESYRKPRIVKKSQDVNSQCYSSIAFDIHVEGPRFAVEKYCQTCCNCKGLSFLDFRKSSSCLSTIDFLRKFFRHYWLTSALHHTNFLIFQ